AALERGKPLTGVRAVGVRPGRRAGVFGCHEVDVVAAGGQRRHVRRETADECDACRVVGGVWPESIDVEPVPGGTVRERRGVLGTRPNAPPRWWMSNPVPARPAP